MSESTLLTIFIGVVAISFLVQCIVWIIVARTVQRLATRVEEMRGSLSKTVETISEKVEGLLSTVKTSAVDYVENPHSPLTENY